MASGMRSVPPKQRREVRRRNALARDVRTSKVFRPRRVDVVDEYKLTKQQWEDIVYNEDE